MAFDLVQTLSDLISLPSVNPMGKPVTGPEYFEERVTDYLQELFDDLGLPWRRSLVEPRRSNIVARIDGQVPPSEGGQVLLFEAHQDTVPVEGMTIEPWTPTVRDGRIYGRGSCDIKGGMSAMLSAVARLAAERPSGMPTIVMACTVNEEHGYTGALALSELWEGNDPFVARRPDAAVVAEPTDLNVVVAHKGALRWRCRTHGRAVHSSQPDRGDNAIYKMARVLPAFEAYHREVVPTIPAHALCGRCSLSIGTIVGGISVNTVPDACVIEVDRRLLPGEDPEQVRRQILDYVASYPGVGDVASHDDPFIVGLPLSEEHNAALGAALCEVARSVTGKSEIVGVSYGTDAAVISSAGVPAVVFGPGSIDQAHTCDEWLDLKELELASEALYQFGRAGL